MMPRIKKWEKPSSYFELLKDPRWQKKRLEIMERDSFKCCQCGESEQTLNVHHCFYDNGKPPWDYPNSSLVTMCEQCHKEEKEAVKEERAGLLRQFGFYGFTAEDMESFSIAFFLYFEESGGRKTKNDFLGFFHDAVSRSNT